MDYTEVIEAINAAASLTDLLPEYGTELRTPTHEEQISCPFHGSDRRPSARHYPDTNSIYCFTCKKAWDPFRFMMEKKGMRFMEAIDYMGRRYGIDTSGLTYNPDGTKTIKFVGAKKKDKSVLSPEEKMMVACGILESKVVASRAVAPVPKYLDFVYLMSHLWCMEPGNPEFVRIARKITEATDRYKNAESTQQ